MVGIGWQELVILAVIFLMLLVPVMASPFWLPARRLTKRRAQALAAGAAFATTLLARFELSG